MRKIKSSWNPLVNLYREFKLGMDEGGLGDPSEEDERLKDASKAGKASCDVIGDRVILIFAILIIPTIIGAKIWVDDQSFLSGLGAFVVSTLIAVGIAVWLHVEGQQERAEADRLLYKPSEAVQFNRWYTFHDLYYQSHYESKIREKFENEFDPTMDELWQCSRLDGAVKFEVLQWSYPKPKTCPSGQRVDVSALPR